MRGWVDWKDEDVIGRIVGLGGGVGLRVFGYVEVLEKCVYKYI